MQEYQRPEMIGAKLHVFQPPLRRPDPRRLPHPQHTLLVADFVERISARSIRRRRRENYNGPMRRFTDPTDGMPGASPWESEPSRQAVRSCVKAISQMTSGLSTGDRRKLQQIYAAVKETQAIADETNDALLGEAAKSLGRYITAIGAKGVPDPEVLTTHIDAMHTLGMLTSSQHDERQKLIDGLGRIVDKKLGRTTTG
jgi:hypothetical protein